MDNVVVNEPLIPKSFVEKCHVHNYIIDNNDFYEPLVNNSFLEKLVVNEYLVKFILLRNPYSPMYCIDEPPYR